MSAYKVTIQAMCEIVVSHDSPVEAQAVAEKLFVDDITSKSEMFTVRIERTEVQAAAVSGFDPDDDPDLLENIDRFNRI